jgi:hypothetical protein
MCNISSIMCRKGSVSNWDTPLGWPVFRTYILATTSCYPKIDNSQSSKKILGSVSDMCESESVISSAHVNTHFVFLVTWFTCLCATKIVHDCMASLSPVGIVSLFHHHCQPKLHDIVCMVIFSCSRRNYRVKWNMIVCIFHEICVFFLNFMLGVTLLSTICDQCRYGNGNK